MEKGSRFDPETAQGKNCTFSRLFRFSSLPAFSRFSSYHTKLTCLDADRNRYWRDEYFRALDLIQPVASLHSLTLAEIALRWIEHHSQLSRERGDNVLIGASSVRHLEENLRDLEKGPLPEDGASACYCTVR